MSRRYAYRCRRLRNRVISVIVSASLTDRCNLNCDYCYAPVDQNDMTSETLLRVVDWAVSATPPGDTLELGFFGGEPLLRLDLMGEAATRAKERASSEGVPLRLRVTTNGTLIDDATLSFLDDHSIDLCISIDGPPPIHDRHRRFRDGRGSADTVTAGLERALERLGRVQVNAVYGPGTVAVLPDTVEHLADLGVRLIHLNIDISAQWPTEIHTTLRDAYFEVADLVVRRYRREQPISVSLIDNKVILFLKDGYGAEDRCGMGKTKVGVGTRGDMYPCERLIGPNGQGELCFGRVKTGPDPTRLESIRVRTGNRNPECETCPIARFCMNWCGCTNYHLTGYTDVAAPVLCASEKASVAAAHAVMTALANNNLFADHLMAYVREGQHPRKGGPS